MNLRTAEFWETVLDSMVAKKDSGACLLCLLSADFRNMWYISQERHFARALGAEWLSTQPAYSGRYTTTDSVLLFKTKHLERFVPLVNREFYDLRLAFVRDMVTKYKT